MGIDISKVQIDLYNKKFNSKKFRASRAMLQIFLIGTIHLTW